MPPRKREKELERIHNQRINHEMFIQAYEKPTQIYKFLRTRFRESPYFLNRNLCYLARRTSPPPKRRSRAFFRVDSLLPLVEARAREASLLTTTYEKLNINYIGLYGKKGFSDPVKVETILLKICHKKRKESNLPVSTQSYGVTYAPLNPDSGGVGKKGSNRISIPTEAFSLSNGHSVKSYHLLLRVSCSHFERFVRNDAEYTPAQKKRRLDKNKEEYQYGTNLTIYDKKAGSLLPEGEYQLLLKELRHSAPRLTHVNATWETIPEREERETTVGFESFMTGPTLKLSLNWTSSDSETEEKHEARLVTARFSAELRVDDPLYHKPPTRHRENRVLKKSHIVIPGTAMRARDETIMWVVYQFLYSCNRRQQTEPFMGLCCPWCVKLDCVTLYSLLKHLKLCHARFTYSFTVMRDGARIDIALNDRYDGSFLGTSLDLSPVNASYSASRRGPIRRGLVSKIFVYLPRRPHVFSLTEFLLQYGCREADGIISGGGGGGDDQLLTEALVDGQRAYISGHNRLYHHSSTCLPIYPKEMEIDSENEGDPKWLQKKTTMMIDDFTDVNDGEKELMKMWNLHVMKHGFVGDCQIYRACIMFLEARGQELLRKNLYRNFTLHMCNLYDFGIVSALDFYRTMQYLQEMIGQGTDLSRILHLSWTLQRNNWLKSGNHKKPLVLLPTVKNAADGKFASGSSSQETRREESLPTRRRLPASSDILVGRQHGRSNRYCMKDGIPK